MKDPCTLENASTKLELIKGRCLLFGLSRTTLTGTGAEPARRTRAANGKAILVPSTQACEITLLARQAAAPKPPGTGGSR